MQNTFKQNLIYLLLVLLFTITAIFISKNYYLIKSIQNTEQIENQIIESKPDSLEKDKINEEINIRRKNSITKIVKKCSPAIVGIHVTRIQQYSQNSYLNDPFFANFFPPQIYKKKVKSSGSGVIISEDGLIITNAHVVGTNALEIIVTTTSGKNYDGEIIGIDPMSDIAVLKIKKRNCDFLKMGNSDEIIIAEWVVALGNPFGLFDLNFQPVATIGIISSIDLDFGEQQSGKVYQDMIQTDASINAGNSGGALVNVLGEIIGMNTFIFSGNQSSGSIGIGFAIPINRVKEISDELVETGKVDRGYDTGLIIQPLNPIIKEYLKINEKYGVIITDIKRKSSASRTNLQIGDVILKVNKKKIYKNHDIQTYINENFLRAGDKINLTIWRDSDIFEIALTLEKY